MTSSSGKRVLLIGDSLLNRTFYVRPNTQLTSLNVPVTSLSEECLMLEESVSNSTLPRESVQGIAYIARYLRQARGKDELGITAWTGVGTEPDSGTLVAALEHCDSEATRALDGQRTRVVTRILRNITSLRIGSARAEYRPQLRFDTPARGDAGDLKERLAAADLRDIAVCLIRVLNPDFLDAGALDRARPAGAPAKSVADRVNELESEVKARCTGAVPIIDLRVLPPGLRIADPRTILCTTIGRLRDFWQRIKDDVDRGLITEGVDRARKLSATEPAEIVVRETFFHLSPLRAVVCFADRNETLVCHRPEGKNLASAELHMITAKWPTEITDGCGMVTGGDAYVAALVDGLLCDLSSDSNLLTAARWAHAALVEAVRHELGAAVDPKKAAAAVGIVEDSGPTLAEDERLDSLKRTLDRIREGRDSILYSPLDPSYLPPDSKDAKPLIAPAGGSLAGALEKLRRWLESWQPAKGRDLIAVVGESRAGKEYALKALLTNLGYTFVGPVNMSQFLAETRSIIGALRQCKDDERKTRVLLIDEVQRGDAARPLLNLMAEKEYAYFIEPSVHAAEYKAGSFSFIQHPVFLMSSVPEEDLLADLQGRLYDSLTIAPLRDRLDEIPFTLYLEIKDRISGRSLEISHRFLDALIHHDYLPRHGDKSKSGLDQRNFRALQDILTYALEYAEKRSTTPGGPVKLVSTDLPDAIRVLGAMTAPDDRFVVYPAGYKPGTYPQIT
jgi:hypothetical protein